MQILKKFIGNDQVDESKILFSNDADFRAESAVSGELNLFKANTSDQLQFGVEVNAGAFKIRNMADPVSAQDAATKNYVDLLANGISWKNAVLVATTANITLSGEQTIDGVLTSASRVLVKNQSAPAQNGIYVSAAGAWSRASDMDAWSEVPAAAVFVQSGSLNADIGYVCTSQPGGTLGTTAITFVQFSASGAYTADNVTLQLISGQFSVKNLGISNAQIANATIDLTSKVTGALPIANGGTGQTSAAAAFNALSPLTTKGDLLSYSTVNARLPVGTNGQVLTADSAQALGVKWASPATGSVTSVAFSDSSSTPIYSVSGSPVTSSGTLSIDLLDQPANMVFAGPVSGPNAEPSFRSLVSADLPDLSALYANVTLSNLSALTAINADLNFTNSGGALRSPNNAGNTGHVDVLTGNSTLANSHSGQLNIKTGNANSAANQNSGDVVINTGFATNQVGSFTVQLGNGGGASTGGNISLLLGASGSGGPGFITLDDDQGASLNLTTGVVTIIGPNAGAAIQFQDGSQGTAGYVWTSTDTTGFGTWMALPASSTPLKELFVLSSGDIAAGFIDLANVAINDSVDFLVKGGGVQIEGASYDYSVSYTGGAGGNTRITFENDLATGGPSALVAGDVVVVKYQY